VAGHSIIGLTNLDAFAWIAAVASAPQHEATGRAQDLKYLLKEAKLPEMVKGPLTVLIKGVAWVPWLFDGIGLLLNREYFFFWLAFFLFLEGVLITAPIYVLVMVIRSALPTVSAGDQARASNVSSLLNDAVVKGIVGNAAFYQSSSLCSCS